MRIELANEYPGGDGYYYASLELPAEEYEIRDALQKIRAVGRENVSPEISVLECGLLPELLDVRLDSPTLDEMNFFAKRLAFLGFEETLAFQAIAVSVPVISAIGTKLKEINERYDIVQ